MRYEFLCDLKTKRHEPNLDIKIIDSEHARCKAIIKIVNVIMYNVRT